MADVFYIWRCILINVRTHLSDVLLDVLGDVQTLLDLVLQVFENIFIFIHGLDNAVSVLLDAEGGVSGWRC